jgi:phytoene dehydrogenase-like protein
MTEQAYDVIVIGAGPGGSACASLLARWGLRTLLLDKNPRAGGTQMTFRQNGFVFEKFPVFGVPAYGSRFDYLVETLGIQDRVTAWCPDPISLMCYEDPDGVVHEMIAPGGGKPTDLEDLLKLCCVKESEREEAIRMLADIALMQPNQIADLDDVSVEEFVSRYDIPVGLRSFVACLQAEGSLEMPADVASASELVRCCQDQAAGGAIRYYEGGYGAFFETLAATVEENGSRCLFDCRVIRIDVENGAVTGVVTEQGDFRAPVVVSNAGIAPTVFRMVGEEHFDRSYVNRVRDLVPSLGFCGYRYFLKREVLRYPGLGYFAHDSVTTSEDIVRSLHGDLPEKPYVWMQTNSFVPGMAPPGKQLIHTGITCPIDPTLDYTPWRKKLEEMIRRILPAVLENVEWKETFGPEDVPAQSKEPIFPGQGGECIGLAQIVGQTGKYKPSIQAPIRGLFYTGTDAGGHGLGTSNAVYSGTEVAKAVRRYHRTRFGFYPSSAGHECKNGR